MHGQKTQRVEAEVHGGADPELISEILHLTKMVRQLKIFHQFKTVI